MQIRPCLILVLSLFISFTSYANITRSNCENIVLDILLKEKIDKPTVKIQPNALAHKIENYEQTILEIDKLVPNIRIFVEAYKKTFGMTPRNREVIEYLLLSYQELVNRLDSFRGIHPDIDYLVNSAKSDGAYSDVVLERIQHYLTKEKSLLNRKFKINRYQSKDSSFLYSLNSTIQGAIGELDVALRLDGVVGQGVFLKKNNETHRGNLELMNLFKEKIKAKFESLEKVSKKNLLRLATKYPYIFKKRGPDFFETGVMQANEWMRTKELDVVTYKDGIFHIWEVKNYIKQVDIEKLTHKGTERGKSIYDQQVELKEIIEFLGLGDIMKQGIIFRRGVGPIATQLLKDHDILVVGKQKRKE